MSQSSLPRPNILHPVHLLAFGFGTGLAPKAPGTFGTLVGVLFFLPLSRLSLPVYLLTVVILGLVGIWLCGWSARQLQVHDHPGIVWDEVVGYLVTMTGVPATWQWMLAGFVAFRVFDILKPWPIGWLDRRVGGGLGIMADDWVAGMIGLACVQLLLFVSKGG